MYFPLLPVEAALPIFNVSLLLKKKFLVKELIKTEKVAINAKS
jgi:hypothetical protein